MARLTMRGSGHAYWPLLLLPLLSLCVVAPLLRHGPSCGHDFGFHLQSWMDAGQQIRHGHLRRWAFSPAFNAGEPRFLFYPPLSWLLGSLLLLVLPSATVPAAYTWIAVTAAALALFSLARPYTSREGAVLAAAVYIGNPYVLFTVFERTAYAELLAAAWLPLLFRAALAETPSPLAIALPVALLWLTNAPAAVMGTYALVVIVLLQVALHWVSQRKTPGFLPRRDLLPMVAMPAAGLLLGFALSAFYLLPAALERRYVQIAMAIIPNMRVEDNFLFGHTGYGPHDQVLHTASLIAVELVVLTAIALLLAYLRQRRALPVSSSAPAATAQPPLLPILALLWLLIFGLLWHVTLPVWHIVPELAFLQFPWRLLSVLGCALGLAVAIALADLNLRPILAVVLGLLLVSVATDIAYPPFRQACEAQELPAARLTLFRSHHGVGATDEYTPTDADNDQLRWDDPAWWLATNPNAPAPNTVPNPAATILDYDEPPPLDQTVSGTAPHHLAVHLDRPEALILNLRDYPTWAIAVNGKPQKAHLQRDDGLLAVALPAGDDVVDVRWHTLPDMWAGDALSLLAVLTAAGLWLRSRRINYQR